MAHSGKYTAPGTSRNSAPVSVVTSAGAIDPVRFSPRVEALRKLVASGKYQVSSRYLAHRILRSAGLRPE